MRKRFKWFFKSRQKKGENKMSKEVEKQVQHLTNRISNMSDRVAILESDMFRLKEQVAEDMKTLIKLVQKKQ
tara:strand:- start:411 stop:626 length:216 start_codon:yes stop_codon:yes gene_type:complete